MINKEEIKRISKKLSYILRHNPQDIGITLDTQGWADTQVLIQKLSQNKFSLTLEVLKYVVETNDKKRFAFNEDGSKIRASQGHSIKIELGYQPSEPPAILFHGTASRFLSPIKNKGLLKQNRTHVHLSADIKTAKQVGARHGSPIILQVKAKEMQDNGYDFFISDNKVWLTDRVPVEYLIFPENEEIS